LILSNNKIIYSKNSKIEGNSIYLSEKDFETPYGNTYNLAIEELDRIQKSQINGKTIPSFFSYDQSSLWWIIFPSLIPKMKKIVNFVEKFSNWLDNEKPNKIYIENFLNFSLIEQICNQRQIKLEYSHGSKLIYQNKKIIKNKLQKIRYQKLTKEKIKNRKKIFYEYKKSIPDFSNKIIFITPSASRQHVIGTDSKTRGELWKNLIKLLEKENDLVCIDLDYTLKGNIDVLKERMESELNWVPVEILLSTYSKMPEKHQIFLENYSRLIHSEEFKKLFEFKGISLWPELKDFFNEMTFSPYIPLYLNLLDSSKQFFINNKPNSVFLTYENGSLAQCLLFPLKKLNIKSIGVQHGIIYDFSSNYSFNEFLSEKNPSGFPFPDLMLLFGNFAKRILEKNGYPKSNLIPFGNSLFFNSNSIQSYLSKQNLYEKFNVDKNKKIILFASGAMQKNYTYDGKYDYDEQIWQKLLESFAGNNDFIIILKPHPLESNIDTYTEILKNFSSSNVRIIQDSLFELIHISTLMVSVFSTSIIDSIYFKKPVIQVKFDNISWPIPVEDFGVVLPSQIDDLSKNITLITSDQPLVDSLIKKRDEFIMDQYRI